MKFYLLLLIIGTKSLFVYAMTGGDYSNIQEFPYTAQLFNRGHFGVIRYCGATIISQYWLVSAAHCVRHSDIFSYQVRVGTSSTLNKGTLIDVDKIFIHGDYDVNNELQDSDICLIKTKKPIPFNDYQQPISISREGPQVGDNITALGFGDGHYNVRGVGLKRSNVAVIEPQDCKDKLQYTITNNMFCTNTSFVDLCFGDSGSPGVYNGKLVGVASQGCLGYTNPNVFTKVANYYDWIVKTTGIKFDD